MFKHHKDLIIKTQEYDVNTELLKLKFQIKFLKCPEGAGEELSSRISNSVIVCEVEVIKLLNFRVRSTAQTHCRCRESTPGWTSA